MDSKKLWNAKLEAFKKQLEGMQKGKDLPINGLHAMVMATVALLVQKGLATEEEYYVECSRQLDYIATEMYGLPVVSPIQDSSENK